MTHGIALISRCAVAVAAGLLIAACGDDGPLAPPSSAPPAPTPTSAAPAIDATYIDGPPTTFTVLAGRTEGNRDVEMFMPQHVRIRAGDTIEWRAHGFEGHTVTFGHPDDVLASIGDYLVPNPDDPAEVIFNPVLSLPSERQGTHAGDYSFINSGFFGVPVEQTYSLRFTEPGLYSYICLVHPFTMTGTVAVEEAGAEVESPETVLARAEAEAAQHLADLEAEARRLAAAARTAPGPGDATTHFVQVGAITDAGQVAVYTPGALEIRAGDTVIFQNDDRNFHNVVFKGAREELPPGIGIIPAPGGRLNFSLAKDSAVAVDPPPEGFGPETFLSSGSMGVTQPRLSWTLRFDTPGTYVYACTIHTLAGMVGVIEVR